MKQILHEKTDKCVFQSLKEKSLFTRNYHVLSRYMQIAITRENMSWWKDDGQKLKIALDGAHVIFGIVLVGPMFWI
jgi:hypothetical protein